MSTAQLDGGKLRVLLTEHGIRQTELSEQIGVGHVNINRWCQRGKISNVKLSNIKKIAETLRITVDALLASCKPGEALTLPNMTAAEAEWLKIYRALSPLKQAKARLLIEEIVRKKEEELVA
jgi:DNA-binding Xre family transcriptional regulator